MSDQRPQAAACLICGLQVNNNDQAEHLRTIHAAPKGGFEFHFDGRQYFTAQPSMLVGELLALVGRGAVDHVFMERDNVPDGERIYLGQGRAVDLTQRPHFFVALPATY